MKNKPLDPAQLYKPCNIEQLKFNSTEELEDIDITVGQQRAVDAVKLGIRMHKNGYNIFAMAPSGTGKLTTVRQLVEHEASRQNIPSDWCYVNNFNQPAKPKAIKLMPGQGKVFKHDMAQLIDELSIAIPTAFDGEEYRSRTGEIETESRQREISELNQLREEAVNAHIILTETPTGYAFSPSDENNEIISPEQFGKLDKDKQHEIQKSIFELQERLAKLLKNFPIWRKETKRKLQALNREVAEQAVNHSIDDLIEKYAKQEAVLDYLNEVQKDIVEHVLDFLPRSEKMFPFMELQQESNPFKRYYVNLMVDFSDKKSAPVIYEDHPNYSNLVGRIDHQAYMGSLVTDFTMIKPGALHKANGGYLIIDARKLLTQPYAWDTLKRTLQSGEIRIESLERALSLISASSLEPEPIPLNLKLILMGEPLIYYLLSQYDPEFHDLFKIAADFDESVSREDSLNDYARLLATIARREKLRPLSQNAVARIIEHSSRMVGDAEKLLTHLRSITDLLTESDYWAENNGHEHIVNIDVQQAIDHKTHRLDKLREKLYENIHRGTVLIDTEGRVTGQVNGLSVLQLGEFSFGQPSRITATTRLGGGKVVDIERETELGGAIHSKGVLILSSFIASRYSRTTPFSVAASLVFEQSYGHIEGDSASLAELCVILSSIAQVPLRQDLAITGSVNQLGNVQPIGGVNEKIEGFFDICTQKGLAGSQGVIIPATNIKHLMLRWDVVHAAKSGQFNIYAVSTVDEALELLTGMEAGVANEQGVYPPESFNGRVEAQLSQFTKIKKEFNRKQIKEASNPGSDD
ncbi:MAG: AAA family ATPase [Methylobacter tundripaludum]|uniref:endopeptidase La n=1 Tax=Methylobacter tundripaludum TaxID=173365 RepID=A0A2S6GMX6_9GAMM|nr:ATP-binding protein [Methylobacter tundripaludum]MCK9635597.1 AAA family ATPase [Methylobacter tundripaludum]PPK66592.1 lon-related putative ATP-dependent protease [Methylobacter tundripaludum]